MASVHICVSAIVKKRMEKESTALSRRCTHHFYLCPIGRKVSQWLARRWTPCHTQQQGMSGSVVFPLDSHDPGFLKLRSLLLARKHELTLKEELFVLGPRKTRSLDIILRRKVLTGVFSAKWWHNLVYIKNGITAAV